MSSPGVAVVGFLAAGLGDRSYLVVSGGRAIVVDPQRDVEAYLLEAERRGARIGHVLETHVHNDYVSGGMELARRSGAALVLPAGSGAAYPHRAVADAEVIDAGPLLVRALHTPGHTPEHTSYLVEPAHPAGVGERGAAAAVAAGTTAAGTAGTTAAGPAGLLFSGGSLLAGSAGRTDLLGAAWTDRLAAGQFASVRRLAALPGETRLHPTHGAGSFCTASPAGSGAVTTIADERATNPALADADEPAFRVRQLAGLLRYPAYYAHMAPLNRVGPPPLGTILAPPELRPAEAAALRDAGVVVVDGRPRERFAAAHLPGALHVELDETFATYVGWLLPWGRPILLVLDPGQDAVDAVRQLARIGWDAVRGVLRGVDGWAAEGRPLGAVRRATLAELRAALAGPGADHPVVLDVRDPQEWVTGTIPGSVLRFVADLGDAATWLPADREVWAICAGGYRASMAGSLLAAAGLRPVVVDRGVEDFLAGR